ncbi:hypothetical protein [Streptomyces sp. NPDC057910]|uniref:hypothetical protein n=1 Tax=Streptomyces sp. NPDC057910 TaxID=3346278 RepID=UPI0036EF158A
MPDLTPEQQTIAAWLTANGIPPCDVPLDSEITSISNPAGARTIRYTAYVRAEDGLVRANQDGHPVTEAQAVPLLTVETLTEWIDARTPAAKEA